MSYNALGMHLIAMICEMLYNNYHVKKGPIMIYFNCEELGNAEAAFVLWMDCMGTNCFMKRSIKTAANFIFKFQSCVANVCNGQKGVHIYPVMDGVYITHKSCTVILLIARSIMKEMSMQFVEEKNVQFRYFVRGAIAYGDVYHGKSLPLSAFTNKKDKEEKVKVKKEAILLGTPVIQAYQTESLAPPLGIAIHSSCRLSPERDLRMFHEWYLWNADNQTNEPLVSIDRIEIAAKEYFDLYRNQTTYSGYDKDKIDNHELLLKQYLIWNRNLFEK